MITYDMTIEPGGSIDINSTTLKIYYKIKFLVAWLTKDFMIHWVIDIYKEKLVEMNYIFSLR